MNQGDKVRFLHTTGGGIIKKIIDNKTVEVEIEDGFLIPALKSELIIIEKKEMPVIENSTAIIPEEKSKPSLNKKQEHFTPIDPQKMRESFYENKTEIIKKPIVNRPSQEIDLHIENLVTDFSKMSNGEMLELQLRTFEMNLDNAIASNMYEITFIHGIGNGVLKQNIHKRLSQNKHIEFFQDARREKFGYGATLVRIK